MVELRQVPNLVFALDDAFDNAARIAALLARPEVERDLHPPPDATMTTIARLSAGACTAGSSSTSPQGISSARAVALVRRSSGAKLGHAGTLDPLATGILPLALGEATKTVRFVAAGRKRYRFRIRWGEARDTDDREGAVTAETAARPDAAAIAAALPRFTGTILQRPPAYSAIKLGRPPRLCAWPAPASRPIWPPARSRSPSCA